MSRWAKRAGKLSMAAARGGRRLQQAGRAADEADAARGPRPALEESDVDTKLTPGQGALLLRYLAGQLVLGRLEMIFLLKYILLVLGIVLILLGVTAPIGVALLILFALAAVAQWLIARAIGRLGAFKRLAPVEDELGDAATVWWPNLKRELVRVGLPPRPLRLMKLGAAYAVRRIPADQEQALRAIDWRNVLPRDQWIRARRHLAKEAGPGRG